MVEQVYYEADIDRIVGFGRALNRQWQTGDDEHILVYGPRGLIDLTDQWSARNDADQHAEKRHRGNDSSDRDNEDTYSRLDNQTPITTSIAIGKKTNKKHREDDKLP
jgi:ribonuclease BN (tRNA processing enzyme)